MIKLTDLYAQHGVRALLFYTKSLAALLGPDGALIEWNPAFGRIKETRPAAATLQDFLAPPSRDFFIELLQTSYPAEKPWQGSLEVSQGHEGEIFDCLLARLPDGCFLFFGEPVSKPQPAEITNLLTELEKTRRDLERKCIDYDSVMAQVDEIAHTDLLTFLSNRRQIIGDIQREVAACDRYGKPLTIFMVDIDHFKQVNDTLGHAAGDEVLRKLANLLLEAIRQSDNVGRYGGEEFLVVLPETALKPASRLASRLLKLVRKLRVKIDSHTVKITISIGIAQYRPGQETWQEFIERADKALYQSKHDGRDRWSVANTSPAT